MLIKTYRTERFTTALEADWQVYRRLLYRTCCSGVGDRTTGLQTHFMQSTKQTSSTNWEKCKEFPEDTLFLPIGTENCFANWTNLVPFILRKKHFQVYPSLNKEIVDSFI